MDHPEFTRLFDQEFAYPLFDHGFSFVGSGKTLRYVSGNRDLRIVRQGGKLVRPGVMRSVICFRHTFLRPLNSDNPNQASLFVSDFPRNLTFKEFEASPELGINYRPENSGRWTIHNLEYAGFQASEVAARLRELLKIVENRTLPWANSLTEGGELAQLTENGEQAWCEKRWIEDYERFLSNKPC